jgi:hypothetical protein
MPFTIQLSEQTRGELLARHFSLYAFRATQVINALALPAVWCRVPAPFLPETPLTWNDALTAGISITKVAAGSLITIPPAQWAAVTLGQTLQIAKGPPRVFTRGSGKAVTFDNRLSSQRTCSFLQPVSGSSNPGAPVPFCAFPVTAHLVQAAAPAEAILLFFSTADLAVGEIVADAGALPTDARLLVTPGGDAEQTEGVLVTDTSATRVLTFSLDAGSWSWDHGSWARKVSENDPIVPLLIQNRPTKGANK